jgi:uncharacterized protein YjbI with pentapeptide repeats
MQEILLPSLFRRSIKSVRDNLRIFNNSRIKCIISNILRGSNLRGSGLKDNDLRDNKHRDSGLRDSDLKDSGLKGNDLRDNDLKDSGLKDSGLKGNDLKGNDKRLKKILSNIRPLQSKKLIKGVKKADALVKSYSHCSALWSSYSLYIQ